MILLCLVYAMLAGPIANYSEQIGGNTKFFAVIILTILFFSGIIYVCVDVYKELILIVNIKKEESIKVENEEH